MNDAGQLLLHVLRETNAAKTLVDSLVVASAQTEVLHAHECKACVDTLDRHLRNASAAATALANLANGLQTPRRGD